LTEIWVRSELLQRWKKQSEDFEDRFQRRTLISKSLVSILLQYCISFLDLYAIDEIVSQRRVVGEVKLGKKKKSNL